MRENVPEKCRKISTFENTYADARRGALSDRPGTVEREARRHTDRKNLMLYNHTNRMGANPLGLLQKLWVF